MANDLVEVSGEAIGAILDTHADVVAITGRPDGNIVKFDSLATTDPTQAMLAYAFIDGTELGGDGDTRNLRFQITADAPDEATINELLGVVETILEQPAFLALSSPLDAQAVTRFRHGINLDVTLRVTRPYPVAA